MTLSKQLLLSGSAFPNWTMRGSEGSEDGDRSSAAQITSFSTEGRGGGQSLDQWHCTCVWRILNPERKQVSLRSRQIHVTLDYFLYLLYPQLIYTKPWD